jgi:hypothetical protein
LYRAPVDGSSEAEMVFSVPAGTGGMSWNSDDIDRVLLTPDGSRVIWIVRKGSNTAMDLYAAPTTGDPIVTRLASWTGLAGADDHLGAALFGDQHIVIVDAPDYDSNKPHQPVRLSLLQADGPRTPLSAITDFNTYIYPVGDRYLLLSNPSGFYLIDGLEGILGEVFPYAMYLPCLRR